MRVAALISGGKDSALALYRVMRKGHKVKTLVAMIPQKEDSWMFHYPNVHLTGLFAKAASIPLVRKVTSGSREEEIEDLEQLLATLDVEGVVSGAIASQYQKTRIERVCQELGLSSMTPLWREDPAKLLDEMISQKFEAVITGVYAHGFNKSWLGRKIDRHTKNALLELNRKFQVSIAGEGGEYETLVLDTPFFKKERIDLLETERIWENQSGTLLVKRARLTRK